MTQRQSQGKASLWASGVWYLSHEDFTGNKDAGGRKKMVRPAWGSGLMIGGHSGHSDGSCRRWQVPERERCPQKCSGEVAGKQGSPGPHLPRSEVSEVKHKAQEGQPRFPSSLKLQVLGPSCTRSGCSHPESTGKDMGFYLPGTKHSSYPTCSVACGGGLERPGPVLTHWSWGVREGSKPGARIRNS